MLSKALLPLADFRVRLWDRPGPAASDLGRTSGRYRPATRTPRTAILRGHIYVVIRLDMW